MTWEIEDRVLGAFLGAWAASRQFWSGPHPLGVVLVVVVFLAAPLLRLPCVVRDEAPGSPFLWACLLSLAAMAVILAEALAGQPWRSELAFGILVAGWTVSMFLRPWYRRVATALQAERRRADAERRAGRSESAAAREFGERVPKR